MIKTLGKRALYKEQEYEFLNKSNGTYAIYFNHNDWTIVNKVDTIYKEKVPSTAA